MQEHCSPIMEKVGSLRITPACAGTFIFGILPTIFGGDHPCVCRNIRLYRLFLFRCPGSPLRVQEHCNKHTRCQRTDWDHPCVCRNIHSNIHKPLVIGGSPLRVQEHSLSLEIFNFTIRITPACAGTFFGISFLISCIRDHPCVCRNI